MTGIEDTLLLKTAEQCRMWVRLLLACSWYSLQELESREKWPQSSRKWSLRARPALLPGAPLKVRRRSCRSYLQWRPWILWNSMRWQQHRGAPEMPNLWWSYLCKILGGAPWGPKCSWNKRPLICLQSVTKRIKKGFVTKRDMQRLKNELCPCSLNRGPKSTQWSALQLSVRK